MTGLKSFSSEILHYVRRTLVVIMLMCGILSVSASRVSAREKPFQVSLQPSMSAIRVEWPVKKSAGKYTIYRAAITDIVDEVPKPGAYKKIKTLKGNEKTFWEDRKARKNRYYTYAVKAYNKKGRLIGNTLKSEEPVPYACSGLGRAVLLNNGYGENYVNSRKKLYLYIQPDYHGPDVTDTDMIIYRKEAGKKKYKKIATIHADGYAAEYTDKNVKTGKTYYYKAQIIRKAGNKTYRSKISEAVSIPAVNFRAHYRVRCLTPSGTYKDRNSLVITLTIANRNKYNGKTFVQTSEGEYHAGDYTYPFRFTEYSSDGKAWKAIPASGTEIPREKPIYLHGVISKGENSEIVFAGGEKGKISFIDSLDEMLDYKGPGLGLTAVSLSLSDGTGSAYIEWD